MDKLPMAVFTLIVLFAVDFPSIFLYTETYTKPIKYSIIAIWKNQTQNTA